MCNSSAQLALSLENHSLSQKVLAMTALSSTSGYWHVRGNKCASITMQSKKDRTVIHCEAQWIFQHKQSHEAASSSFCLAISMRSLRHMVCGTISAIDSHYWVVQEHGKSYFINSKGKLSYKACLPLRKSVAGHLETTWAARKASLQNEQEQAWESTVILFTLQHFLLFPPVAFENSAPMSS